ncbi:MAG: hypothetical protein V2J19_04055 [Wenzhouxiangella sp.]|jgi:hypothetical protein|nr:hypothetical protein [Wenzhouxiangella sp.]
MNDYRPDQLAGFRVGDLVDLPTIGRCQVLDLLPPSLLKLRAASGAELKAGIYAVRRVPTTTTRNAHHEKT